MVGCRKELIGCPDVWYYCPATGQAMHYKQVFAYGDNTFQVGGGEYSRRCGNEGWPSKTGKWYNYCEACMRKAGVLW